MSAPASFIKPPPPNPSGELAGNAPRSPGTTGPHAGRRHLHPKRISGWGREGGAHPLPASPQGPIQVRLLSFLQDSDERVRVIPRRPRTQFARSAARPWHPLLGYCSARSDSVTRGTWAIVEFSDPNLSRGCVSPCSPPSCVCVVCVTRFSPLHLLPTPTPSVSPLCPAPSVLLMACQPCQGAGRIWCCRAHKVRPRAPGWAGSLPAPQAQGGDPWRLHALCLAPHGTHTEAVVPE